jgi:hypothetical protein
MVASMKGAVSTFLLFIGIVTRTKLREVVTTGGKVRLRTSKKHRRQTNGERNGNAAQQLDSEQEETTISIHGIDPARDHQRSGEMYMDSRQSWQESHPFIVIPIRVPIQIMHRVVSSREQLTLIVCVYE